MPRGADGDAASLSRPEDDPSQTVENHRSPTRLSLLTGDAVTTRSPTVSNERLRRLIQAPNAETLHARWLTSVRANALNESVYYPYTSLKYHTLLTAALLHAYRRGHSFEKLWLVARTSEIAAPEPRVDTIRSDSAVRAHETVLWTPVLTLSLTPTPTAEPRARLGDRPTRSFADVWSRLSSQPLPVDDGRHWRLLDAQLRRIRSWSTALAYIEEFVAKYHPGDGGA